MFYLTRFKPAPLLIRYAVAAGVFAFVAPLKAQEIAPDTLRVLCNGCHSEIISVQEATPHSALDSPAWLEKTGAATGCVVCHGDAPEHVAAGGGIGNVFAFRVGQAGSNGALCLECHSDTHPSFTRSAHARAGVGCLDCHRQHDAAPGGHAMLAVPENPFQNRRVGAESQVCFDCHGETFTQFSFNERHRLHEGAIECVSCHNPHEPASRSLLGGFEESRCAECHADKSGPFVFEHDASRVEGCASCHAPHGSQNRHLLTHQRVAELCYSCHASVPQFHLGFSPVAPPRFDLETQCTNCHSAIHGSNFDHVFLR